MKLQIYVSKALIPYLNLVKVKFKMLPMQKGYEYIAHSDHIELDGDELNIMLFGAACVKYGEAKAKEKQPAY